MKRLNLPRYCRSIKDDQIAEELFLEDVSEERTISSEELERLTSGAFMLGKNINDRINYENRNFL